MSLDDIPVLGSARTGSNAGFSGERADYMDNFVIVTDSGDDIEFYLAVFSFDNIFGVDATGFGACINFGDQFVDAPVRK